MSEKMIKRTDEIIAELVREKVEFQKAYNYYHGVRDEEQFKYLEENFGIGSPTSVKLTPMVKKHIDALIGEYLGTPILPKVSCKDSETISAITREKSIAIAQGVTKFLKDHLNTTLLQFIDGKDTTDKAIKQQIDKIKEDIDQNFVSKFEIAAQNVIQYVMQSRQTDVMTKLRELLLDLLITGYTFFRVKESSSGTNIQIEVLDPLNTFIDRNPESPYIKDSHKVVVRKWLSKQQILNRYGKDLTREDVKNLKETWSDDFGEGTIYGYTYANTMQPMYANSPGHPVDENGMQKLIPVYEVEWLEADNKYVMQRYSSVRIGGDIYIINGKDENVIRSKDNPSYASLTVNGVYFTNRTSKPYSLMLACADLKDKYDLLIYYRDVLIANSGVKGQIMDFSLIPANLGVNWPERVKKWMAYRKAGTMMIDSTQEGRNEQGAGQFNTMFSGYDDTLPAQAIQAIQLAIDSVEATTSSITGVFRERLNGIQQRDAVTNIQQGVNNSFIITKPIFQQMDLVSCEIISDCLNQAKRTWKKGLSGVLILGDHQQRVFTALPEDFTFTDYDIHVISSTQIMQDMQQIQALVPEFIKSGQLPADILFEVMTSKSLSEMKFKVKKALKIQKEENNQLQQLQQQLEQTTQQAQQLQQELEKAQQQIKQLDEQRMKLETDKMNLEYKVDWFKAQTDKAYRERQLDIEEKKVDIELAQLRDGNPFNDQIRMK
jgi:hypothetical protein